MDPPAVSFSVTRATGTAGALLGADNLQIHLLTPEHVGLAGDFATSGADRFTEDQGWTFDEDGAPRLAGARARLAGTMVDTVSVGGSVLIVAQIADVSLGADAAPLIYVDRTFHAFDPGHAPL